MVIGSANSQHTEEGGKKSQVMIHDGKSCYIVSRYFDENIYFFPYFCVVIFLLRFNLDSTYVILPLGNMAMKTDLFL